MKFDEKETVETLYYMVYPEKGYIMKLFQVYPDGTFSVTDSHRVRLDNVLENPIRIDVNSEEWSLTLNGEMGILFENELMCKAFMDEIFFIMETLLNVPEEQRSTSSEKVIVDLEKQLEYMEEVHGKFNDIENIEEQGS